LRRRNWPIWLPMTREASIRRWSGSRTVCAEKLSTPMMWFSEITGKAKPPRRPVPSHMARYWVRGSATASADHAASPVFSTVPVSPCPGRKLISRERARNCLTSGSSTDQPS
jgi:hypothetical protein